MSALVDYECSDELFGHEDCLNLSYTGTNHIKGQVDYTNANKCGG